MLSGVTGLGVLHHAFGEQVRQKEGITPKAEEPGGDGGVSVVMRAYRLAGL
jgi:hypothetical protein